MKFHVYRDKRLEWRWTLKARNGLKIADGAEGYKRKASALRMCGRINGSIPVVIE